MRRTLRCTVKNRDMGKHVLPPTKRLLTRDEAAQYCGLGSSPVPVPAKRVRPGKQGLRYDVRDLDEWIDNLGRGEQIR